jgi:F420H(2)-dependent quinone reductase
VRYTFHNRVMNPAVSAVLRSPIHGLASRTNALVTLRGRRSGRSITVPLRYAEDDTGMWIHPAGADRKTWWRNLEGGAPVTVRLRGRELAARAEAFHGDASRVAEGLWAYYRRFPMLAKSMGLSWDPSSVDRAAARAVMVRVELGPDIGGEGPRSPSPSPSLRTPADSLA